MGFRKVIDKERCYYYINYGDMGIMWTEATILLVVHLLAAWGVRVAMIDVPLATMTWALAITHIAGFGVTGGVHRLWCHKSYQAKLPLRIAAMIAQTIAGQDTIYEWSRVHRVHHKWVDTDGDPHNIKRGVFFTHCGWLMTKRHPELLAKYEILDFSDLLDDPVVKFQKDHYNAMYLIFALGIPVAIPVYLWSESWATSFLLVYIVRYLVTLHSAWFVNSAAHMWGDRPYNPDMAATDNPWVSYCTNGEGYHNYHHQFPRDYRASEDCHGLNLTRHLIDLMTKLGQAYNLRTASDAAIVAAKVHSVSAVVSG
ncbi:Delta(9)-fatty-acid desaturase fat-7 [Halotydeus destructor]|nr:Delta(9)-fatty-acid desaturase fat-7 [Halotydeus destructor]